MSPARRLADGREIAADFVIVGVGIVPATALAEAAGLAIDNGIAHRRHGPHLGPLDLGGGRLRLASPGRAGACGSKACRTPSIRPKPSPTTCWARDSAYVARCRGSGRTSTTCKLQIAGLNTGYDRIVTRAGRGRRACRSGTSRATALLAVDAMNDPRAYMVGKRLIEAGASPDPGADRRPGDRPQGAAA